MTSQIPIPLSLSKRPKDKKRGLVIPYVQLILSNGEPDFRIHDLDKVIQCLEHKLCGLCGEPIKGHVWFPGGELCKENHKFVEPPAHKKCLQFAFKVCPFLTSPSSVYSKRSLPDEKGHYLDIQKVSTERPKTLYAFQAKNYTVEAFTSEGRINSILITVEDFTKIVEDKYFVNF
jgi:hypothetical protein